MRGHCPPGNYQWLITKRQKRQPNSYELVGRPGGEVFWETPVPPLELSSVGSLLWHQVNPDHVVQTSSNNSQLHLVTSKRRYHSILCRRTTKIFVTIYYILQLLRRILRTGKFKMAPISLTVKFEKQPWNGWVFSKQNILVLKCFRLVEARLNYQFK